MLTKLPRWVEVGGFALAAVAGAVNAVALLGFEHQGVSHLTGTSTLLGVSLADGNAPESLRLVPVLAAFVLGAALSGAITGSAALSLGRRYSVALLVEAGLLLLSMWCLGDGSALGHLFASVACGLQNGMVSTYSGAAVRTTHVSGLFTDLGTMLGHRLRGHPIDRRKAVLYLLLIAGFVLGGVLGTVGYRRFQFLALAGPAAGAAALAVLHWVYRHRGHNGNGDANGRG